MSDRYWFDSFPGIDQEEDWAILDPYGTPYSDEEQHRLTLGSQIVFSDSFIDKERDAPYANQGQNRGGVA